MRFHYTFLLVLLVSSFSYSLENCKISSQSSKNGLKNISDFISDSAKITGECVEQEIFDFVIDGLLEPYRIQNLALKYCSESANCLEFLKTEASRISRLPIDRFEKLGANSLWLEIIKYSGFNRVPPPKIQDLPIDVNVPALFEKIKQEKIAKREVNKNEHVRLACVVLAGIIGPGKFKALGALKTVTMASKAYKIERSHDVEKLISKNRLPQQVKEKFLKWSDEVEKKGLEEVKKIPGYHDEPLKGIPGRHSARLSDGYRVCYDSRVENGVTILKIITISLDHKNYCQ